MSAVHRETASPQRLDSNPFRRLLPNPGLAPALTQGADPISPADAQPSHAKLTIQPAELFALSVANSGRIVACPCQYFLRRSVFRIFPDPVLGTLSHSSMVSANC